MRSVLRVFKGQSREMLAAVILGGASLGAAVGLLATSAWLISMASTRPPVLVLEVAIVSVRFFGLSRGILKYASRILEHNSALKIQTALRVKIYERFSRLLPSDYADLHRGNLLAQIINDVELAQDLWLRVASPWLAGLISGSAGITIIHWLLPACGNAIGLLFLLACFAIPFLAMIASSSSETRNYESQLFDQIMQIAESAPESLIFNYHQDLLGQVASEQEKIAKIESKNASRSGLAASFYFILLGTSVLISLWFAARGALTHQIAGINVAVIALVPLAIFDGLSSLPSAFSQLRQVLGAIRNIEPMLVAISTPDVEDSLVPPAVTLELKALKPLIADASTKEITSLVKSGETLFITGRSGSGKSSIINSLLGFVPYSGQILLNGKQLQPGDLHIFTTLLQDDYLFGTSIRENLKIGNPAASDAELLQVLELVELLDFVTALPEQLDTMIGSMGYNFSGGEKQRLKLARLLLRDTSIYILDEPYEFLDAHMVARISERVAERLSDRLVILVSHLPLAIRSISISLT
ncbi:MAG: thiol reductant ABC exporter subunit CydC [Actinomycetes bacterium]